MLFNDHAISLSKNNFTTKRSRSNKMCHGWWSKKSPYRWIITEYVGMFFLIARYFPRLFRAREIGTQLRYFKVQLETVDLSTVLRGIKYSISGAYSQEPRAGVYCVKLNFKISKLAYCNSQNVREYLNDDPHGIKY